MTHYYCHPLGGKDTNPGTDSDTPFATFTKALTVATGSDDVIHLLQGIYFGGDYDMAATATGVIVKGYNAIMNCAGYDYFIEAPSRTYYIHGVTVTGFTVALQNNTSYPGALIYYYYCTIYQKGGLKDITYAVDTNSKGPKLINSLWWGVNMSKTSDTNLSDVDGYARNSIVIADSVHILSNTIDDAYCASNTSVIRGTGGWDVATYPIPVYSEDADSPDLRFNPDHAQYTKYATGGYRDNIMGNPSRPIIGLTQFTDGLSIGSDRIFGPWINDYRYYDPSFPEITISAAGNNNKINFQEAGGELTGTLVDETHITALSLMTAVGVAMNVVATATITATMSDTVHSIISTDGDELSLLSLTGSNFADSIYSYIGFDITTDHAGQTLYVSESPPTNGPGAGAPATSTEVNVTTYKVDLNLDSEPAAKSGRTLSPVMDFFIPVKLKRIYISKLLDGLGAIDNSAGDALREIEIRANDTTFSVDDAAATTTLDWTLIQYDGLEDSDETYRFWQIRVTIRLNKVS